MLDGTAIAAILTGILALVGAVATAWMSGWNEQRVQARANRKALARYAVPLLIAAWDLANWFHEILDEGNYSPERCKAYGSGWNSQFTSYLIGQYFAGVHIIREMTHFFAHMKGERADLLKKLLWKIQDEFVSMHYEGRESLEMRWFEGDILAVQEKMTTAADLDGDGTPSEMQTISWIEFKHKYEKGPGPDDKDSVNLKELFSYYEDDFQRIIKRRFKQLYSTTWRNFANPQTPESLQKNLPKSLSAEAMAEAIEQIREEEDRIEKELLEEPNVGIVIPDHRIRRLQHLLSDLVELLDIVSKMDFNRPVRRCKMELENRVLSSGNPLGLHGPPTRRVPCDCHSLECNKKQVDFDHRNLRSKARSGKGNLFGRTGPAPVQRIDTNPKRRATEKQNGSEV